MSISNLEFLQFDLPVQDLFMSVFYRKRFSEENDFTEGVIFQCWFSRETNDPAPSPWFDIADVAGQGDYLYSDEIDTASVSEVN